MFDGNLAAYADRPESCAGLLAENGVELVSVYPGGNFVYPDVLPDELVGACEGVRASAPFGAADSSSAAAPDGPSGTRRGL